MSKSLRQLILEADDIQQEVVEVPEWGGLKVLVRGMTVPEKNRLSRMIQVENDEERTNRYEVGMVIATARDPETGELLFEEADRDSLLRKSNVAIGRLFKAARRLSGLDITIEQAVKN